MVSNLLYKLYSLYQNFLSMSFFKEYLLYDKKLIDDYWYPPFFWQIDSFGVFNFYVSYIQRFFSFDVYCWNSEILSFRTYKNLPFTNKLYILTDATIWSNNVFIIATYILTLLLWLWDLLFGQLYK